MPEQIVPQLGAAKEPVIYTIPDQFYGVAAKAQLAKVTPEPALAGPVVTTGAPTPPPTAQPAQAKGSKTWILIPIFAILLLAGLGVAAWWFLRPPAAPAPATPTVTLPPEPEPTPVPEPEPQPEPTPEPATTTEETPPAPSVTADDDTDGLTNGEETLYGTDAAKGDTDDDGYSDSVEVTNLYNPAGFKPTKLIEAGLVKMFVAAIDPYELLSPTPWTILQSAGQPTFTAGAGEQVSVTKEENPERQSVLDWYLTRNPGVSPTQAQAFTTKSGLEGVRSPDGMTAFISIDGNIYGLRYEVAVQQTPQFRTTFTMMLNSFSRKP